MGLLSWLFPSEADRIAQARKLVEQRRFREARDKLDGITSSEADEVLREAENGLVRLNLEAVISWAEAGEDARVEQHLTLAEELHRGGLEQELQAARRKVRELRAARREEAARTAQPKVVDDDPLGLTGRALLAENGRVEDTDADPEDQARWGLILANYPESLREGVSRLGPTFQRATLDLENGRPDLAFKALQELGDDEPLVCWERSRAAYALGDPTDAIRDLQRLSTLVGHQAMPGEHSGVMLARILAEIGHVDESYQLLTELRSAGVTDAAWLFAQVSYALAQRPSSPSNSLLAAAEQALRELLIAHPKQTAFHHLLAKVRLSGGYRLPAMQALEAGLAACCDAPGKCGSKPPDPAIQRDLATLYLEDRLEMARALELADAAMQSVERPVWEDMYLQALVARQYGDPDAAALIEDLRASTPPHQVDRLNRYLAA